MQLSAAGQATPAFMSQFSLCPCLSPSGLEGKNNREPYNNSANVGKHSKVSKVKD
jgi:hypothetical protein